MLRYFEGGKRGGKGGVDLTKNMGSLVYQTTYCTRGALVFGQNVSKRVRIAVSTFTDDLKWNKWPKIPPSPPPIVV